MTLIRITALLYIACYMAFGEQLNGHSPRGALGKDWNVVVPVGARVKLTLVKIHANGDNVCKNVTLRLTSSNVSEYFLPDSCEHRYQRQWVSKDNVTVRIIKGSENDVKFSITFAYEWLNTANDTCSHVLGLEGGEIFITNTFNVATHGSSPMKKIRCTWSIQSNDSRLVNLTFTDLHTRYSGDTCADDKLVVYDGPNDSSPVMGTYCGHKSQWSTISSLSHVLVILSYNLVETVSFRAQYSFISNNSFSPGFGIYEARRKQGFIDSVKYPLPSYSLPSELTDVYLWHIVTTYGHLLRMHVFSRSVHKVTIYDGLKSLLVQRIIPVSFKELPDARTHSTYITSSFQSTVEIHTFFNGPPFNITYTTIKGSFNTCKRINSIEDQYSLVTLFPLNFLISGRNVGQCIWYFRAARPERFLQFTFEYLNLTDIDNCAHEGVVIFDGLNTSAPSYGPFCRHSGIIRRIVTSTAYLTILYYSYGDFLFNNPILNASIEETLCKGHFLTEANSIFETSVESCYMFQRIPEMTHHKMQSISLAVKKSGMYFIAVELDPLSVACGYKATFSCSEYFAFSANMMSHCHHNLISGISVMAVNGTVDFLSFISHCNWSRAGFSAKVTLKEKYVSNVFGECLKSRNVESTVSLPTWSCGLLTLPANSPKLTLNLRNCQEKDSTVSNIEIAFFVTDPCRASFEIKETVYSSVCQSKFKSGSPVHSLEYLYYLRCRGTSSVTRVSTIAADALAISVPTNYEQVAVEYDIVPTASVDIGNFNRCKPGYVLHQEFCYELTSFQGTWRDGDQRCKEEGGDLVSILDEDEYMFILDCMRTIWKRRIYAGSSYNAVFIGLRDTSGGEVRWTDSNPLIYTKWYSPGDQAATYTQASMLNGVENDLHVIINENQRQPLNEPSSRCTLMIVRNPYVGGSWFKIPCSYTFRNTRAICKQPATGNKSATVNTPSFGEMPACPLNWVFLQGSCYRLVTSMGNLDIPVKFNTAKSMCLAKENSSLAVVDSRNIDGIRYLLRVWRHRPEYGAIWVRERAGSNNSVLSSTLPMTPVAIWGSLEAARDSHVDVQPWKISKVKYTESPVPDPSRTLNVLCERTVLPQSTTQCLHLNQMRCNDGTCISSGSVCDLSHDCQKGEDEQNCMEENIFYTCGDGNRIPISSYCDFISDCKDGRDESNCMFPSCTSDEFTCESGQCIPKYQSCNFITNCFDGSDESQSTCGWIENCTQLNGFRCYSGDCIALSLRHNLINDCPGQAQEDEQFSMTDYRRGVFPYYVYGIPSWRRNNRPFCSSENHVRCRQNNPSCLHRGQICIYDGATGCGDNSHLKNCKHFDCKGFYKCPSGYCIPKHRVCDGTWDCTGGSDELACSNYTCPGGFRCRGERRCLEQSQVCNGVVDCKYSKDDERFCDLTTLCPSSCKCFGYVLICENTFLLEIPSGFKNMRAIMFSGNRLSLNTSTFSNFSFLGRLDLSNNKIRNLPPFAFSALSNLFELLLKGNLLSSLNSNTFDGLSLDLLDLQMNGLKTVSAFAFHGLKRAGILQLQNNDEFLLIHQDSLQEVDVSMLLTDSFRFCCLVNSSVNCTPQSDQFSSCSDMIANNFFRVSLWILGVFAFAGNLFVFVWRLKTERDKVNSALLINLAISDFLMGVYMLLIASVDAHFLMEGDYYIHDPMWRNSGLCRLAGVLSFMSSEMSVYTLVIITIDRVIVTVFAFKVRPITKRVCITLMLIGWLTWLVMATVPFYTIGNGNNKSDSSFYGGTSVCLPFTLSTNFNWISVFVFIIFNFAAFLGILLGYIAIFIHVRNSAKNTGTASVGKDAKLAKKLSLIIFSDFCCWLPIVIAGLLSVTGHQISPEFSAWVAVFIMPLNSALNPYIYTLSTFKQRPTKRASQSSATSLRTLSHRLG